MALAEEGGDIEFVLEFVADAIWSVGFVGLVVIVTGSTGVIGDSSWSWVGNRCRGRCWVTEHVLHRGELRFVSGGKLIHLEAVVKAGGNNTDLDLIDHVFGDGGAKDNVGVGIGGVADDRGGFINFAHGHVGTTGDVEENTTGTFDRDFQER